MHNMQIHMQKSIKLNNGKENTCSECWLRGS